MGKTRYVKYPQYTTFLWELVIPTPCSCFVCQMTLGAELPIRERKCGGKAREAAQMGEKAAVAGAPAGDDGGGPARTVVAAHRGCSGVAG